MPWQRNCLSRQKLRACTRIHIHTKKIMEKKYEKKKKYIKNKRAHSELLLHWKLFLESPFAARLLVPAKSFKTNFSPKDLDFFRFLSPSPPLSPSLSFSPSLSLSLNVKMASCKMVSEVRSRLSYLLIVVLTFQSDKGEVNCDYYWKVWII